MKIIYFLTITAFSLLLVGCERLASDDLFNQGNADLESGESNQNINNQSGNSNINSKLPVLLPSAPDSQPAPVKPSPTDPVVQPEPEPADNVTPDYFDVDMAFAPQAPYAVWDELHQEACEEASMIMVFKYFNNESLNAHIMEQGILNLIKWEENNGYKVDVTAEETVKIIQDYFGLNGELMMPVTIEKIKKELAAGKLIIVPVAGRELGNPYFTAPGPIYHMLVVKGYDDKTGEFITNDPGTKRGKDYRYQYQILINAIADWDHQLAEDGMTDEEIVQGRKVIISVSE